MFMHMCVCIHICICVFAHTLLGAAVVSLVIVSEVPHIWDMKRHLDPFL